MNRDVSVLRPEPPLEYIPFDEPEAFMDGPTKPFTPEMPKRQRKITILVEATENVKTELDKSDLPPPITCPACQETALYPVSLPGFVKTLSGRTNGSFCNVCGAYACLEPKCGFKSQNETVFVNHFQDAGHPHLTNY